jgi:hypothetical protein
VHDHVLSNAGEDELAELTSIALPLKTLLLLGGDDLQDCLIVAAVIVLSFCRWYAWREAKSFGTKLEEGRGGVTP